MRSLLFTKREDLSCAKSVPLHLRKLPPLDLICLPGVQVRFDRRCRSGNTDVRLMVP